MPSYFSPGIYVEEVPGGARPIGSVGTSIAALRRHRPGPLRPPGKAVPSTAGRSSCGSSPAASTESTPLARAVFGFFDNGGGRCYVVNVGEGGAITGSGQRARRSAAAGGHRRDRHRRRARLPRRGVLRGPARAWRAHPHQVAICDPAPDIDDIAALTRVATPSSANPPSPPRVRAAARRGPGGGRPSRAAPVGHEGAAYRPRQSDFGAFYFPWLRVRDPLSGELELTPPSGHVAGIWARTDALRGVHKAPANEPVRGALDLTYRVTHAEQDVLNPRGVNCIRYFAGEGIRVWGARTLAAERQRVALPQRPPAVQHARGVHRRGHPLDRVRAQRLHPVEARSAATSARSSPACGATARCWGARRRRRSSSSATRRPTRRRSSTPAGRDAYRHRAGQAGRVRRLQAQPVRRRHRRPRRSEPDMPDATARPAARRAPGRPVPGLQLPAAHQRRHRGPLHRGRAGSDQGAAHPLPGGRPLGRMRAIPGRSSYVPVTLRFGLTASRELWDWLMSAVAGHGQPPQRLDRPARQVGSARCCAGT